MSDSPRQKAPVALRDFPRKAQFPPLLAAAAGSLVTAIVSGRRTPASAGFFRARAMASAFSASCVHKVTLWPLSDRSTDSAVPQAPLP